MASCFAWKKMVLESNQQKNESSSRRITESLETLVGYFLLWDQTGNQSLFLLTNKKSKNPQIVLHHLPKQSLNLANRQLGSWFLLFGSVSGLSECHLRHSFAGAHATWYHYLSDDTKGWKSFNKIRGEKNLEGRINKDLPWRNWFEILKISEHSILSRSIPTKRNWVGKKIQPPTLHPNNKTHFPGSSEFGQSNMQSCLRHSTHTQWPHSFMGPSSRSKSKETSVKLDDLHGFQGLSQMQTTKNQWQCTVIHKPRWICDLKSLHTTSKSWRHGNHGNRYRSMKIWGSLSIYTPVHSTIFPKSTNLPNLQKKTPLR